MTSQVQVHNRMPVVLSSDRYDDWLNPAAQGKLLQELMHPYKENEEEFEVFPVSNRVNSPANDAPDQMECLESE